MLHDQNHPGIVWRILLQSYHVGTLAPCSLAIPIFIWISPTCIRVSLILSWYLLHKMRVHSWYDNNNKLKECSMQFAQVYFLCKTRFLWKYDTNQKAISSASMLGSWKKIFSRNKKKLARVLSNVAAVMLWWTILIIKKEWVKKIFFNRFHSQKIQDAIFFVYLDIFFQMWWRYLPPPKNTSLKRPSRNSSVRNHLPEMWYDNPSCAKKIWVPHQLLN